MYIASFDIGKKNFAFVIEKYPLEEIKNIDIIEHKNAFIKTGLATPEMKKRLEKVYKLGEIVLVKKFDLTTNCTKKYLDPQLFINMTNVLDEYLYYWEMCDVILVEQQMSFGRNRYNTLALKLGQHCYSYFSIRYMQTKTILEFPAYHKTKVLGALRKFKKPQRKKWAVYTALYILNCREDYESMILYFIEKKLDDLSDCLLMGIAYLILTYIKK